MPLGKCIDFGIYIANQKMPEYKIKDKVYTEVDLLGPASFMIEEENQRYPVVPFKIHIQRKHPEIVWITIHLDGQVIASRPLIKRLECDGVKVGNEIHELLFSLPRIAEGQTKASPLGDFAGTIRIEVKRAFNQGEMQVPVFQHNAPLSSSNGYSHKLHHLTKKDVQRAVGQTQTGSVVSREGRPLVSLAHTNRFRTAQRFVQTQEILEDIVLHYRPRISSHQPPTLPPHLPLKQEQELTADVERRPLSDVGNLAPSAQQQAPKQVPVSGKDLTSVREDSCSGKGDDEGQLLKASEIKRRESCVPAVVAVAEAMIPVDQIKRRESCMLGAVPTTTAHDAGQALISEENIKRRESCMFGAYRTTTDNAVTLIPEENIKRRESCMLGAYRTTTDNAVTLIPEENIKRRESCMFGAVPRIFDDAGALIPEGNIKRRESSARGVIAPQTKDESSAGGLIAPQTKQEAQEEDALNESYILIDEDDEVYVYDFEGDSLVYMGDDDCYFMDVSHNVSLVDLDRLEPLDDQLDLADDLIDMSINA